MHHEADRNYIIPTNYHHHHHLFLKRPFLPRSARVRRLPRYEASPHIPEHRPFLVQTKLVRVFFYTFFPCLPTPAHTSHPCHHHISTGRHPSSLFLRSTIHMPKPNHYEAHYIYKHHCNCLWIVMHICHGPYGRCHVAPSAASLAGV